MGKKAELKSLYIVRGLNGIATNPKLVSAAYTSHRHGQFSAFAASLQRGITGNETETVVKLRSNRNILLNVNDATQPAVFALLTLPYYRAAISWS